MYNWIVRPVRRWLWVKESRLTASSDSYLVIYVVVFDEKWANRCVRDARDACPCRCGPFEIENWRMCIVFDTQENYLRCPLNRDLSYLNHSHVPNCHSIPFWIHIIFQVGHMSSSHNKFQHFSAYHSSWHLTKFNNCMLKKKTNKRKSVISVHLDGTLNLSQQYCVRLYL